VIMCTYKTYKSSYTTWKEFGRARKITVDRGCTEEQALRFCENYNNNRTKAQIRKGTKMEYTQE